MAVLANSTNIWGGNNSNSVQTLIENRREWFQTIFMRPVFTLLPKPGKEITRKKFQTNMLHEYRWENPLQNISKSEPLIYKKVILPNQLRFIPGMQIWIIIQKTFNVIHYIIRLKKKKHIIMSTCLKKKSFDKIRYLLIIKSLSKPDIKDVVDRFQGSLHDPHFLMFLLLYDLP